jgi:heterodisulfide reductase subunit C
MKVELSSEKVNSDFVKKVEELSGQNILSCYQCGKCSAGCPSSYAMDLLPLCASCLTCSVRCPRGVDIAAIFEALRLVVTRDKDKLNYVEPSEITAEQLEELPQIALISNFRKFTG